MSVVPIILSLETATRGGSVFLSRGSEALAARTSDPTISHSSSLLGDIDDTFNEAGLTLHDIDLFACASGPGSFTGLRIGLATLKAMAATLERPCVGVPTLRAVAHSAGTSSATVALLPAGRGEVFAQMFSVSEDFLVTELDSPAHLSPQKLFTKYGGLANLIWAGEGASLQRKAIEAFALQQGIAFGEMIQQEGGWRLAASPQNMARHVAALAFQKYQRSELQSAEALQAIYVRPSDAELNQRCQ